MQFIKTGVIVLFLLVFPSLVKANIQSVDIICDDWPPYQIVNGNQINGFSTKVTTTVFARMGVDVRSITSFPWKRAVTMMKKGQADALFSSNYTKERTAFAYYPEEPLVDSPWVMWVREGNELQFKSFEDLLGKSVGLVRGYSYTPELLSYMEKHSNVELVVSDEQNFRMLNANRLDYIVAELRNGQYIVNEIGLKNIKPILSNPIKTDGLYIIFNKRSVSKEFVENFSKELEQFKQEPLYNALRDIYFWDY